MRALGWVLLISLAGVASSTFLVLQLRQIVAAGVPETRPAVERATASEAPRPRVIEPLAAGSEEAQPGPITSPSEVPGGSDLPGQLVEAPAAPEGAGTPGPAGHGPSDALPQEATARLTGAPDAIPDDEVPAPGLPARVRVRDGECRVHVARLHARSESSGIVLLPDGRLGWPEGLSYTDEPFVPATREQLKSELLEGPYRGFSAHVTDHYVIVFQGTPRFAEASGRLLESLYDGLLESARWLDLPAHDAEFPLVAVIYRDEPAFRAANPVPEDVEAFYDIVSNRIHFFESSDWDREAPDLAARRKPQTVAHEGTHQILQNIGVQPRLASWPLWLVEGLAELFAPTTLRPGDTWDGANRVNPFHMATIRELEDPLSLALQQQGRPTAYVDRAPGTPLVEHVVGRTDLSPTDYAIAWALTHFLFNTQAEALRDYLKMLGELEPGVSRGPSDHLADFRRHFGQDLAKMDRLVGRYLSRLRDAQPLAHYAVVFEQPLGPTVIRRAALVSQSPALILQWVDDNTSPRGGPVTWRAWPFPTRSRALLAAEGWLGRTR